jgi:hypothetical protein
MKITLFVPDLKTSSGGFAGGREEANRKKCHSHHSQYPVVSSHPQQEIDQHPLKEGHVTDYRK